MPRTSFLIPVRNGSRFIVAALESALAQTDADLEVVVVDDDSSDDTPLLVEAVRRRDPRVRLVCPRPRSGLVGALNLGLEQARGTFVARLDADDLAVPNRVETQRRFLEAHPSVAVVGSALELIDVGGVRVGRVDHPTEPSIVGKRLLEGNVLSHSAVLIRRACLETVGGYRAPFAHAEDYDLWLRLSDHHALANVAEPLTKYRIHSEQVSERSIEEQAVSALAARTIASIRRETGHEPNLPARVDTAFLLRLGLTDESVAQAIAQAALEWSSMIEKVDRRRAARVVAAVSSHLGAPTAIPTALDRRAVRYAFQVRQPWHALVPVLRLLRTRLF